MAARTFMGALRASDRVRSAIDSHPDVARSKENMMRAIGLHGMGSAEHKAATEEYRQRFQSHPSHTEYKEHIRHANELEAKEKTKLRKESVEMAEEEKDGEGALKYVKKIGDDWCLVSDHTGKTLKNFGDKKPSRAEADKALRVVEFYKHGG